MITLPQAHQLRHRGEAGKRAAGSMLAAAESATATHEVSMSPASGAPRVDSGPNRSQRALSVSDREDLSAAKPPRPQSRRPHAAACRPWPRVLHLWWACRRRAQGAGVWRRREVLNAGECESARAESDVFSCAPLRPETLPPVPSVTRWLLAL